MNFSTHPHKNLYVSIGIAVLIVGVGASLKYNPDFLTKWGDGNVVALDQNIATSTITTRDTDGDGLYDWEEQLYGTNIEQKDTDGDKTFDKEEVNAGRDPLKANTAPDGKQPTDLTENALALLASSAELSEKKKAFLAQYLTQAGREVRETTYRDLLSKFDAKNYTPEAQSVTGLNIVSDNTNEGVRVFLNEFGKVVLKHKTEYAPRNEIDLMNEYMETQNSAVLEDLDLCVIEYQNLIKDLRTVPVPSGMAKNFVSIIEGYEGMKLGVAGLRYIKSDPIEATGGYESYTIYRVQVVNGYATLVTEVGKRGITFTRDEPGYMFYANVFGQSATGE